MDNPLGRHTPEDHGVIFVTKLRKKKKVESKGVFVLIALYFTCNLEMQLEHRDSKSEILLIHPDKLQSESLLALCYQSASFHLG